MRRLIRIILNLFATLSLLLCLAAGLLWLRTLVTCDFTEVLSRNTYIMTSTRPGKIQARINLNYPFSYYSSKPPPRFIFLHHAIIPPSTDWMNMTFAKATTDWRGLGMRWTWYVEPDPKGPIPTGFIILPLWMIMAVTLPLPAVRIARWRKRRRRFASGHCQMCGYDLRATPDRCPECGAQARR